MGAFLGAAAMLKAGQVLQHEYTHTRPLYASSLSFLPSPLLSSHHGVLAHSLLSVLSHSHTTNTTDTWILPFPWIICSWSLFLWLFFPWTFEGECAVNVMHMVSLSTDRLCPLAKNTKKRRLVQSSPVQSRPIGHKHPPTNVIFTQLVSFLLCCCCGFVDMVVVWSCVCACCSFHFPSQKRENRCTLSLLSLSS